MEAACSAFNQRTVMLAQAKNTEQELRREELKLQMERMKFEKERWEAERAEREKAAANDREERRQLMQALLKKL